MSITITFVAEASLQSRTVWSGLYFEKPLPEISSSHTAIPAWACLFPLAFHSLSSVSWSLTLKTSVHSGNCTPSSYPCHRSLAFIWQSVIVLYILSSCCFISSSSGGTEKYGLCLPFLLSLIKFNAISSLWLLDIAHPIEFIFFRWAGARCEFCFTYFLLLTACDDWHGFVWCLWTALPVSGRGMGASGREGAVPFWINRSVYRTLSSQQLSCMDKQNQKYSLCWGILEVKFQSEQWLWKWIDECWPFNHCYRWVMRWLALRVKEWILCVCYEKFYWCCCDLLVGCPLFSL